jgi:eukaryotic-like serine/threonine-protein kinase
VCATGTAVRGQLHKPPEKPAPVAEPRPEPEPRRSIGRRTVALAALVAAIVACAAVGIVLGSVVSSTGDRDAPSTTAAVRTQLRPKPAPDVRPAHSRSIRLVAGAAFDPLGDGDEHSDIVPLALDRDPSTAWSSEDYRALNKAGVGFVVDAKRPVSPTRLTLKIPTPGFALAVYGARRTRTPRSLDGWTKLGAKAGVKRNTSVALDAEGDRYRHLLLWVTSLPPGGGPVKVAEVRLRV